MTHEDSTGYTEILNIFKNHFDEMDDLSSFPLIEKKIEKREVMTRQSLIQYIRSIIDGFDIKHPIYNELYQAMEKHAKQLPVPKHDLKEKPVKDMVKDMEKHVKENVKQVKDMEKPVKDKAKPPKGKEKTYRDFIKIVAHVRKTNAPEADILVTPLNNFKKDSKSILKLEKFTPLIDKEITFDRLLQHLFNGDILDEDSVKHWGEGNLLSVSGIAWGLLSDEDHQNIFETFSDLMEENDNAKEKGPRKINAYQGFSKIVQKANKGDFGDDIEITAVDHFGPASKVRDKFIDSDMFDKKMSFKELVDIIAEGTEGKNPLIITAGVWGHLSDKDRKSIAEAYANL